MTESKTADALRAERDRLVEDINALVAGTAVWRARAEKAEAEVAWQEERNRNNILAWEATPKPYCGVCGGFFLETRGYHLDCLTVPQLNKIELEALKTEVALLRGKLLEVL